MKKIVFYSTPCGFGHISRDIAISKFISPEIRVYILSSLQTHFKNEQGKFVNLPPINGVFYLNDPVKFVPFIEGETDNFAYTKHLECFLQELNKIKPDLVVVDVTPEIALLSKLAGYKTVLINITGHKTDQRNLLTYSCVDKIIFPYPRGFTDISYLSLPVREKCRFVGGFSRFDLINTQDRESKRKLLGLKKDEKFILCLAGKGTLFHKLFTVFQRAMAREPNWEWKIIKDIEDDQEIIDSLAAADLVVSGTGDNTIAEISKFQIPFITVPIERPYQEQLIKASNAEAWGMGVKLDFSKLDEKILISKIKEVLSAPGSAEKMKIAQRKFNDGRGGAECAKILEEMVAKR